MKQIEIPIYRDEPIPVDLPDSVLVHCDHWRDAFFRGLHYSTKINTQKEVAEALGVSKGYVKQATNTGSRKHFNPDQIYVIQVAMGNNCITQFMQLKLDGKLINQKSNAEYQQLALVRNEYKKEEPVFEPFSPPMFGQDKLTA